MTKPTPSTDKFSRFNGWISGRQFTYEQLLDLQSQIQYAIDNQIHCNPEPAPLTMDDFIKAKESLEKASVPMSYTFIDTTSTPITNGLWKMYTQYTSERERLLGTTSLANLQGTHADTIIMDDICSTPLQSYQKDVLSWFHNIPDEGKKESEMCYKCNPQSTTANATVVAVAADPTKDMRDHLNRRLKQVYGQKTDELYHAFYDIDTPKTKADILARLKEGKFTLDDESFDKDGNLKRYHELHNAFSWRVTEVDSEAYGSARDAVRDEHTKADDVIAVMSPEQGLEALRAFEAWQPTGLPN